MTAHILTTNAVQVHAWYISFYWSSHSRLMISLALSVFGTDINISVHSVGICIVFFQNIFGHLSLYAVSQNRHKSKV